MTLTLVSGRLDWNAVFPPRIGVSS